jgi:hypothetical protein
MRQLLLALFLCAVCIASAYAQPVGRAPHYKKGIDPNALCRANANAGNDDRVELRTSYGIVDYWRIGSRICVNGALVYDNSAVDRLQQWGPFRLSDDEVLLFEGSNLGSGGITGETFFLVLKPNKAPAVMQTPINALETPITKVSLMNDAIYVEFSIDVGDSYAEIKSPLRFVTDKVVVDRVRPAIYTKKGPRLTDKDCSTIYELSKDDCVAKSTEGHEDCAKSANAAVGVGSSLAEMGTFRWISRLPGFNEEGFNQNCLAWCTGKQVSYKTFSATVCNIKN